MSLPNKGKILALDIGTRRTGVAICDPAQKVAFMRPELMHQTDEELQDQLEKLIKGEKVGACLIGIPLSMDGLETEQTTKVRKFIETFTEKFKMPIETMDERLTSIQAQKDMKQTVVDSRAAQILLETYIASKREFGNS